MAALFIIINLGISRLRAVRGEAWLGKGVNRGKPKDNDGLWQNALFLNWSASDDFFEALFGQEVEGGEGSSSLGHQIYLS